MEDFGQEKYSFEEFQGIIDKLFGENGCPWDKAQTHETLMPHLVEECYEVLEAHNNDDNEALCEELGDVLLQVLMNAKIAQNSGNFTFEDVVTRVSKKMKNRHPHIFGDIKTNDPAEIEKNWQEIKLKEKGQNSISDYVKTIPKSFPPVIRAVKIIDTYFKMQMKRDDAKLENIQSDLNFLSETIERLNTETTSENVKYSDFHDEIGQMMLKIITISRKFKINPDFALTNAIEQFINRFESND